MIILGLGGLKTNEQCPITVKETQNPPKIIQPCDTDLGYPSEFDGKTVLLMIVYISVTGYK